MVGTPNILLGIAIKFQSKTLLTEWKPIWVNWQLCTQELKRVGFLIRKGR